MNLLYDSVVYEIAKNLKISNNLEIHIDKSKTQHHIEKFNYRFRNNIKSNPGYKLKIHHSYSEKWAGLQFADLIAWSYFQKYERNNSFFVNLIKVNSYVIEV